MSPVSVTSVSVLLLFIVQFQLQDAQGKLNLTSNEVKGRDCGDLYLQGVNKSGVYRVKPLDWTTDFEVFCDMRTEGGGWTVIQRRGDYYGYPEHFFLRKWQDYKRGFGDLNKEFWLGNDQIFALTSQGAYQLRVDLWDADDHTAHAKYARFWIANETDFYRIQIGGYSGTAGDAMLNHNRNEFSTVDRDPNKCVRSHKGAWWSSSYCHNANLNGLNLKGPTDVHGDGIVWFEWKEYKYSLSFTEMKIRGRQFLNML